MTKLKNHPYSQCHVEVEGDTTIFVSYTTAVIFLIKRGAKRFVECTGTYSKTTIKQIGYFLKEYAPDLNYYDMKNIVGMGEVEM